METFQVTPESALVAGVLYRVHSVDVQAFRCGKVATTVVLRDGDTEIVVTTAGDWKKVLGIESEVQSGLRQTDQS